MMGHPTKLAVILKSAGSTLTTQESDEFYSNEKNKDQKMRGLLAMIATDLARRKLKSLYRNFDKGIYTEFDYSRLKEYRQVAFHYAPIEAGDVCFILNYAVSIPPAETLRTALSMTLPVDEEYGMQRVTHYVDIVHSKIKHAFDHNSTLISKLAIAKALANETEMHSCYPVIGLETIARGEFPAVCSEKALVLAALLNGDAYFMRLGIRAYVVYGLRWVNGGYELSNSGRQQGNLRGGGFHMWVRLTIPREAALHGFDASEYILDPTSSEVFVYDDKRMDNPAKYVELCPSVPGLDLRVLKPINRA
jgi:hypothetical protein